MAQALVIGLSSRRLGFVPGSVQVRYVVDKVAMRHDFLRVLWFSSVSFIPPLLSILTYHLGEEQ
jgi:hypothetical protein